MSYIINLDYALTDLLNKLVPHNFFFNYFFSFFSLKGSFIFIWLVVILIILVLEERKSPGISKRDRKFIILFSISFLLTFLLTDVILKNIFFRPRPFPLLPTPYNLQPFVCPTDFSFPSAHASTAFAAATIMAFFDKKRRWFYFLIAILISYSRIYLGCHYFLDVIFGALLGYLISKLILHLTPNF